MSDWTKPETWVEQGDVTCFGGRLPKARDAALAELATLRAEIARLTAELATGRQENECRAAGYCARVEGKPTVDCPGDVPQKAQQAWMSGWIARDNAESLATLRADLARLTEELRVGNALCARLTDRQHDVEHERDAVLARAEKAEKRVAEHERDEVKTVLDKAGVPL